MPFLESQVNIFNLKFRTHSPLLRQALIQNSLFFWIPAFAGMTKGYVSYTVGMTKGYVSYNVGMTNGYVSYTVGMTNGYVSYNKVTIIY